VPAAARLQLIGCALLAAMAIAGCGADDSGTSTTVTSQEDGRFRDSGSSGAQKSGNDARSTGKGGRPSAAGPCQGQLGSFVASMDSLRRRLAVGVTFDQYLAEVRGIRSTYRRIPIQGVQIDCLDAVGTPAEKAFNRYIEAANDWGECVSEAGCSSETVEPVLQRRWRIASHFLGEADDGLSASAP
jgi:hypothetical protein